MRSLSPIRHCYDVPYVEGKLFLKVNRTKTIISHVSKIKYFGCAFYRYKGKCRLRVHPKSVKKMKDKLRVLTNKNTGWGNDYRRQKVPEMANCHKGYWRAAKMLNSVYTNKLIARLGYISLSDYYLKNCEN